jgi:hypothetical protein
MASESRTNERMVFMGRGGADSRSGADPAAS